MNRDQRRVNRFYLGFPIPLASGRIEAQKPSPGHFPLPTRPHSGHHRPLVLPIETQLRSAVAVCVRAGSTGRPRFGTISDRE
jgi:hypothetical protein